MEQVLTGLLLINGTDVYKEYGAFLAEKAKNGHENYDTLFAGAGTKEQVAVDIREEDGEKLPDELVVRFKPRDLTLYFAIHATGRAEFLQKRAAFLGFLRTGDKGWLTLQLTEVDATFKVYLKDVPSAEWEQLSFADGSTAARFAITFREPKPSF